MAGTHFKETQDINLGWRWIFFIGMYVLMCWALVEQFRNALDVTAIISIIFSLVILIIFNVIVLIMSLETEIDDFTLSYRYKPFHAKPKEISWDNVSEFYLRNYKPFREFGGHGIQRRHRRGRSYTISGTTGLQVILKDGKKILVGTQKPKELLMIIEKLKKQN